MRRGLNRHLRIQSVVNFSYVVNGELRTGRMSAAVTGSVTQRTYKILQDAIAEHADIRGVVVSSIIPIV